MSSTSDLTEQLRALFRRERNISDRHPSPEQIVAYHERRLSPQEAEEMRAHLAACPDCTSQLLGLVDLLAEDDPGADMTPAELDAAWQRQRQRLFPPAPVVALDSRRPRGSSPRWAWTSAAALGVAAALLAVVAVDQRGTIERLTQPQVNPPLVNLAPADAVRRGVRDAPELRFPAEAERAWLILNPAGSLDSPSYDVEVIAPGGEVVFRFQDLQPSEAGNFRLEIPGGALREGTYRLLLFGKAAGQRQTAEEFALRVSHDER